MPKCQICDRGPKIMQRKRLLRGKLNPTGKIKKQPNLQTLRIEKKRFKVCTKCLKTLKKKKKQKKMLLTKS